MLKQYKRELNRLTSSLIKKHSSEYKFSIDPSEKNTAQQFERIYELNSKIQEKHENLRITSEILNQSCLNNFRYDRYNNLIKKSIDKALEKTARFIFFEIFQNLLPINQARGDYFLDQADFENAFSSFKNILRIDPNNKHVHSRLSSLKRQLSKECNNRRKPDIAPISAEITKLSQTYRFCHLLTVKNKNIRFPTHLLYSKKTGEILISDPKCNLIHKFKINGHYCGNISHDFKEPSGMFEDSNNNIWICDWGNSILKIINPEGKLLEKLPVTNIVPKGSDILHPRFGTFFKNNLFLLLTDKGNLKRSLISFDGNNTKYYSINSAELLNDLKATEKDLFVSCVISGRIYSYDSTSDQFKQLPINETPMMYSFAHVDGNLILITYNGKSILKFNLNGNLIFAKMDLNDLIPECSQLHMVISSKIDNKNYLFASDSNKNWYVLSA